MSSRSLCAWVVVALSTSLFAAGARADPPAQPSRFEVLAALAAAARTPLAQGEACDGVVGEPLQRPTLGDWVAYNLSLFEGPSTIAVECRGGGPSFDCDVEFRTGQGTESPWSWGVRGRFRRRAGKLRMLPRPFTCTGAG